MVRVRFAPSPTGALHLGSARTAIFNWLYARHSGGQFVLRIEDTDLNRSESQYIDSIISDMKWMGMDYNEFYKQSERFEIYRNYVMKLVEAGKAYYCTCSKDDLIQRNRARGIMDEATKYDGHCRQQKTPPDKPYVIRVDVGAERDIIFKDVVRKRIRVNTKELDDFVLWKSDDSPTYNFAVVIDDALMKISHIIRGEDHITNTAKQIILYEYLGFAIPEWAHLPLVFDKDRAPLSKRKGSTNIDSYRKRGILPDALLNYIARLGWSHGNDEVFTLEDLIRLFDLDSLSHSNAIYDEDKMIWLNARHLKMMELSRLKEYFLICLKDNDFQAIGKMNDDNWLTEALDILRQRANTLIDIYEEMKGFATGEYALAADAEKKLPELNGDAALMAVYSECKAAITAQSSENLEQTLRQIADAKQVKFGALVQLLRIKLTGKLVSPDIVSVIRLLGQEAYKRL